MAEHEVKEYKLSLPKPKFVSKLPDYSQAYHARKALPVVHEEIGKGDIIPSASSQLGREEA